MHSKLVNIQHPTTCFQH